jgi:branched-chain amino acid transport system ATP-binding protein
MLEVNDIRKSFEGIQAVDGCSFTVKKGSITGLIGPNGAGKTTLFNLITGFYKPDRGEILFKRGRIDGLPPHQVFRRGICRTFQIPREFTHMTLIENLMVMPENQLGEKIWNTWVRHPEVRKQERTFRDKAIEVLEFVELIHLKDEYAGHLSGGQKKLLELAKTLMADPELILLDEPGEGVNRTLMKKLVDNIKTLGKEKGITFLIIEHDLDLVMNLCNPIIVMSEGRKLAEGAPDEIRRDERVLEAYLGGQYR